MILFTPKDNDNSKLQIGTQMLSFPRGPSQPWPYAPPYAKYGYGYYDPLNEFRNAGLFGSELDPQTERAFKILSLSIPVSIGAFGAGAAYGLLKGSFLKGMLIGSAAGAIPVGLALINTKLSVK